VVAERNSAIKQQCQKTDSRYINMSGYSIKFMHSKEKSGLDVDNFHALRLMPHSLDLMHYEIATILR